MPDFESMKIEQLHAVFEQEISMREGTVTDRFVDGDYLLVRAVLPNTRAVRTGDDFKGGVALRHDGQGLWLYLQRK